ncbi:MAG: hypothetical protein UV79_C0001G0049 [candidate division TM6 bacterium GW2011_GWF2_43_17]|nr:MAG: hypothetical protein UV79_C0001G0049 [candidate division TM6 bacterium GW2011_GWF2_43_17]HAU30315.1 hypothetical protein [Candidatus Dependentiae bacterium]
MKLHTLEIINHSTAHKCIALVIGILIWQMVSAFHYTSITLSIPLCLFNTQTQTTYCIPKQVKVTLYGAKAELRTIDFANLAVHLNAQEHVDSHTKIRITSRNLLLPSSIRVLRFSPTNLTISKNS